MINVKTELNKARQHGHALGAFNTSNLEVTKAICAAGQKVGAPFLIQTTPSALKYAGLKQLYEIVINEIESCGVKAAIHLDHAKELPIIEQALKIGYKSVMFDGSKLSFNENVTMTQKVVSWAKRFDAAVEAEIGVIGHEEGGHISGQSVMSAPEEVLRFVKLTGIDSVAISVGNQHGAPKGERVNLRLLEKISQTVHIPIVLHGSSGLPAGDIREAMRHGVAKFNIDTKIKHAFTTTIEESEEDDYRDALSSGMEAVEEVVIHYMKLFSGK